MTAPTITTDAELLARIRDALKPAGTLDAVRLQLRQSSYFNTPFVGQVLDELAMASALRSLSPAQRLALHVLMDSACVDKEEIQLEEPR